MNTGIFFVFPLLFLIRSITCNETETTNHDSLQLLHVVFRHGDRTPLKLKYPTDPHRHIKFAPYGIAQLTNNGKQRVYNLGRSLRRQYGEWLSHTFTISELSAYTTNTSRSKSSLALVLAGLYQPKGTPLEWNLELNWNPINYEVIPNTQSLLLLLSERCNNFAKLFSSSMNKPELQFIMEKNNDIKEIMVNNTKLKFDSPFTYLGVYDLITVQEELGLEVPKWFRPLIPKLEPMFNDVIRILYSTTQMKQLAIGGLIEKIIKDSKSQLTRPPSKRTKLYMYSGHDFNVAMILKTVNPSGFYERPPYGACIMIEVHTINDIQGIKILYQPNVSDHPYSIPIEECSGFCPLDKFAALYKDIFPVSTEC